MALDLKKYAHTSFLVFKKEKLGKYLLHTDMQYRRKAWTIETKDNTDAKLDFRRNKTKRQSKQEVAND